MPMLHPSTFEYLKPTDEQIKEMAKVRSATAAYADILEVVLPDGADKQHVLRKLRDVANWSNIAITRHDDGTPRK